MLMRRRGIRLKREDGGVYVGELSMCSVLHGHEWIARVYLRTDAASEPLTLFEPALINLARGFTLRGFESVGDAGFVQEWNCELLTEREVGELCAMASHGMGGAHNRG